MKPLDPAAGTDAAAVLAHAGAHPARLGATRLIGIDGPSGSGKTTLAREVARLAGAEVVRLDDLYPGWDGLFAVDASVLALLGPLAEGRPGRYRRYDWESGTFQESHEVSPAAFLVLEGVGAGNRAWRGWITTLVWVDAPAGLRLERAVARDGERARGHLEAWARDEERLYADQRTRDAADLVVDTGASPP